MNVAIEYILRNGRIEQLLTLPCSLFLENPDKKKRDILEGRLVVTLTPKYESGTVIVRQFRLAECTARDMLPNYKENIIHSPEIFEHSDVVVPNYKLLEFCEQPFNPDEKQVADLPMAAIQERQYQDRLRLFFSPKAMNLKREDWLWNGFKHIYIDSQIEVVNKKIGHMQYHVCLPHAQRDFIAKECKAIYKVWEFWKKSLLLNTDPAAELVFGKYYDSQFLNPTQPKPPPKKKAMSRQSTMYFIGDEWPDPFVGAE